MKRVIVFLSALFICITTIAFAGVPGRDALKAPFAKLPLSFVKNEGQKARSILYYEQGSGHAMVFTRKGISFYLTQSGKACPEIATLTPLNAAPFTIEALEPKMGKVNYFIGRDPSGWKSNIPTYGAVLFRNIYQGIDMKFYGTNNDIEYDLIVSPGADPSKIRLSYSGIKRLSLTSSGDLEITLKDGSLSQKKPRIYQAVNGEKVDIGGKFILADAVTYGFAVGTYDKTRPLVIDPALVYSTYFGGDRVDSVHAIALDSSANVYVAGYTNSSGLPVENAYQATFGGSGDAFIAKLDSSGSLVYSTYLGGSLSDAAYGIAVDASGNAYVAGGTSSADFPVENAYQATFGGGNTDAFIAKLDSSGSLVYSTYMGGNSGDAAYGIAVDASGNAYVAGGTSSADFPVRDAYQPTYGGSGDAFIAKLDSSGSSLAYSTFLGGTGNDVANGIALDSSGNAYVAGYTYSADFPVKNAYQATLGGGDIDAFIAKLDSSGSSLAYSTYLGGAGNDKAYGIAVDASENTYVAGYTYSADFPVKNAYQRGYGGNCDAFAAKLDSSGSSLAYSTFLGGTDNDKAYAIAVDSSENIYISGITWSGDFPVEDACRKAYGGFGDAFVAKLDSTRPSIAYSTYLGGSGVDQAFGVAVDASGNAYVAGGTSSADFPVRDAYQRSLAGNENAFIAGLGPSSSVTYVLTVSASDTGTGTITGKSPDINCESACSYNVTQNRKVTLAAKPASDSAFTGWSGACSGTGTCQVTMTGDTTVTAAFASLPVTLTVSPGGDGTGTVTSNPKGIQCGSTCSYNYALNRKVTLAARATNNSTFTGWSGACSGTRTCSVTLTGDTTVTAVFAPPVTLTVSSAGNGTGTVTSNPKGIQCGSTCSAGFKTNSRVALSAAPASDSYFTGWTGKCTGVRTTCTFTITDTAAAEADFSRDPRISVKPVSRDFGRLSPGKVKKQIFSVRNVKKGTLSFTSLTISGSSSFSLDPGTCAGADLGPGKTCAFSVTYAPLDTASASAQVSINSSDPATPTFTVSVAGNTE